MGFLHACIQPSVMLFSAPMPAAMRCRYLFFQLKTHHALFLEEGGDEEEDEPLLSIGAAVGLLAFVTVLVAFASE